MFNGTLLGASSPVLPIDCLKLNREASGGTRLRLVTPGTNIILQGIRRDATVRIVEGCICLFHQLADGRRQILDVLGAGRVFGNALAYTTRYSAVALTFTHLETIDVDAERDGVEDELRLMLHRSHAHAILLGRKTAAEKVATALLDLAQQFARRSSDAANTTTFTLYLTRADLADWLGLTLETVSRCLNSFKRDGLIAFKHPEIITIVDEDALHLLAAGQPSLGRRTTVSGHTSSQPS
ncbi:Crp/Fnr family transcriptional regulator [Shinella granuli]|uniref:CRP/FNR family transcriptional regulator n=1 Tax=Shinella granuli TaxID=323621 RepID=A0A4R2BY26_SHIGR|nr:helix-turn-helix domain-containing protein [Shinella granuli]TCN31099.1 CRP/FNR family transcriptional regulator [Shinella granuli]